MRDILTAYAWEYQFVLYLFCMTVFAFLAGKRESYGWRRRLYLACASASWSAALLAYVASEHWRVSLGMCMTLAALWMLALVASAILGRLADGTRTRVETAP